MPPEISVRLGPDRRRMAASMRKLIEAIGRSDQKLYARDKPFLPIFPTDDTPLQDALTVVYNRLVDVAPPS